MYYVLCTMYCVLYIVSVLLCTMNCVLCTVYYVRCTIYCVLCTVYYVLCTSDSIWSSAGVRGRQAGLTELESSSLLSSLITARSEPEKGALKFQAGWMSILTAFFLTMKGLSSLTSEMAFTPKLMS